MSRTERSVQIAITGNKVDDEIYLLNHVRPLFQNIFGLELTSRYRHGENTMDLYRYSKEVALTLHSWGMPIGRKKLARLTPATPLEEVSFVRGLFDTDGCAYCKYGPYMQIQFKLANHDLLTYVKECLERLGFHPTSIRSDDTKFRFFLSRQTEVNRFFKVVEPRNPKHHKRFRSASRPQLFRHYKHRLESRAKSDEPTKAYRNSQATPRSVGQPSEPFAFGAVV